MLTIPHQKYIQNTQNYMQRVFRTPRILQSTREDHACLDGKICKVTVIFQYIS